MLAQSSQQFIHQDSNLRNPFLIPESPAREHHCMWAQAPGCRHALNKVWFDTARSPWQGSKGLTHPFLAKKYLKNPPILGHCWHGTGRAIWVQHPCNECCCRDLRRPTIHIPKGILIHTSRGTAQVAHSWGTLRVCDTSPKIPHNQIALKQKHAVLMRGTYPCVAWGKSENLSQKWPISLVLSYCKSHPLLIKCSIQTCSYPSKDGPQRVDTIYQVRSNAENWIVHHPNFARFEEGEGKV